MMVRRWLIPVALLGVALGLAACSSSPAANDFEAGECTDASLTGAVGEIETVDCDEEHTAEAFAQFDLDDGDFPGDAEVQEQATEGCQGDRFEEYVGVDAETSNYIASWITPTEQTWNDADDRTVICIIAGTKDGSTLEGSAEGTEA